MPAAGHWWAGLKPAPTGPVQEGWKAPLRGGGGTTLRVLQLDNFSKGCTANRADSRAERASHLEPQLGYRIDYESR